jgi:hypothetical protein
MPSLPNNDTDVYLVIEDFGASGPSFLETDLAQADRDTIVRNFISGQYEDALRVVSFNVAEGWSRDVSEDIAGEIIDRAYDADKTLTDDTKRFIDLHLDHQRRPRARSVLREQNQVARRKA